MKKALLVLTAVAVSGLLFSSCVRSKSCECKDYDENGKLIMEYTEPIVNVMGTKMKCKDLNVSTQFGKTECK